MDRRDFHRLTARLCSGLLTTAPLISLADAVPMPRARLTHPDGSPFRTDELLVGEAWIFSYPYRTTPCFLVRLPEPDVEGRDIVAFSAICSHKMTHPSRLISHIAYRAEPVSFEDSAGVRRQRSHLISCCSERSVYDPGAGAAVLAGPAPAPLARIALELEDGDGASPASDESASGVPASGVPASGITAVASTGADRYESFLQTFGFRLALEYGVSDVRRRVGKTTTVESAARFSRQTIRC